MVSKAWLIYLIHIIISYQSYHIMPDPAGVRKSCQERIRNSRTNACWEMLVWGLKEAKRAIRSLQAPPCLPVLIQAVFQGEIAGRGLAASP